MNLTTVVISRVDIEKCNTGPVVKQLLKFLNRKRIRSSQGSLALAVHGYDDDRRELFQVPEVCRYLKSLSDKFPYWFYFLNLDTPILNVIAFCVSDARLQADGTVAVDPEKLALFQMKQFDGLNRLFKNFDLDRRFPRLNEQISIRINNYYEAMRP